MTTRTWHHHRDTGTSHYIIEGEGHNQPWFNEHYIFHSDNNPTLIAGYYDLAKFCPKNWELAT